MTVPTTNYNTDDIASELNISTSSNYTSDDLFTSSEIDDSDDIPNANSVADLKSVPNQIHKFEGYTNNTFIPDFIIIDGGVPKMVGVTGSLVAATSYGFSPAYQESSIDYDKTNKILIYTNHSISNEINVRNCANPTDFLTEYRLLPISASEGLVGFVKIVNGRWYIGTINGNHKLYNSSLKSWSNLTYVSLTGPSSMPYNSDIGDLSYGNGVYYFITLESRIGTMTQPYNAAGILNTDTSDDLSFIEAQNSKIVAFSTNNIGKVATFSNHSSWGDFDLDTGNTFSVIASRLYNSEHTILLTNTGRIYYVDHTGITLTHGDMTISGEIAKAITVDGSNIYTITYISGNYKLYKATYLSSNPWVYQHNIDITSSLTNMWKY